jgi:hypothetical protein
MSTFLTPAAQDSAAKRAGLAVMVSSMSKARFTGYLWLSFSGMFFRTIDSSSQCQKQELIRLFSGKSGDLPASSREICPRVIFFEIDGTG